MSSQLAAIPTDKFALAEDVALHGLFHLGLCCRCFQRELRIERVQLEEITVGFARRRTRPSICRFLKIVNSLSCSARKRRTLSRSLREVMSITWQIEKH